MLISVLAAFLATAAHACPQFGAGGELPVAEAAVVICYDGYALGHSAARRGPVWSAEHLTAAGVTAALKAKRAGDFHPEPLLPRRDRAELRDYRCAPDIDRGHMTPVGDFGTASEEGDTFTLANMTPQNATLNEGLWAGIEGAVRAWAQRSGDLYIVTGPLFAADAPMVGGRVAKPSQTWKAVYDPSTGLAGAYLADNDASGRVSTVSVADLASVLGFDPMPGVPASAKAVRAELPAPLKANAVLKPRACH